MDSGGMIARTPWRTFPANQVQNVIVDGLKQNQPYMFNVAARSGEWDVAYTGAKGTPTYQRGALRAGAPHVFRRQTHAVVPPVGCVCSHTGPGR